MSRQVSRVSAASAGTAALLCLLAGCGSGNPTRPDDTPVVASATASVTQAATPSSGAEISEAVVTSPPPSPSARPGPTQDQTQDPVQASRTAQKAATRFVRAVLTVGYPDRDVSDYTDRIRPLMTRAGFAELVGSDSVRSSAKALPTLHAQRARSAPLLTDDPSVTVEDDRATVRVAYETVVQQEQRGRWRTLRSLGQGRVTLELVRRDDRWLVAGAS